MTRQKEVQYAESMICQAQERDAAGDAAGRNNIISRLWGDSELPRRTIASMIRNAGLERGTK